MLTATAWLAIVHMALYSAAFNYSFFAGIYFSLPLLAPAIAVSGSVEMPARQRSALIAMWLCVGAARSVRPRARRPGSPRVR
jgi:hypothetical protein